MILNLPRNLTLLHHSSILFLETLVQPSGSLQLLVDTAHDTLLLTVDKGLGGEIVDTVIKAALDHLGVHLDRNRDEKAEENGKHEWK